MKRVYAVTGANGHLGRTLVATLIERGHSVCAVVRSEEAAQSLPKREGIKVSVASLDAPDQLQEALKGAWGVFHAAAPTKMWARQPEEEIEQPIFWGTYNLLFSAARAGVTRVLNTSTAATVGLNQKEAMDESQWNHQTAHPQFRAKKKVEQQLSVFAKNLGLSFISVCPPSVLGPGFVQDTPSLAPYRKLMRGELPFLPPMCFHVLDVRDEAAMQVLLMESAQPRFERYLLAGHYVDLKKVIHLCSRLYPERSLPRWTAPKGVFYFLAAIDWVCSFWTKKRELTQLLVRECIGCDQKLDGRRFHKEFPFLLRPWEETVTATLQELEKVSVTSPFSPSTVKRSPV